MRAFVAALALVGTAALTARADERATTAFLGSETTWRTARLSLQDVHYFWRRGRDVFVEGSGRVVARVLDGDRERRYEATIPAQRARTILRLAIEVDLLTIEPPRRPGGADEGRPALELRNARGGWHQIWKWSGDEVPGWDRIAQDLEDLSRAVEELHRPVHDGPWDATWSVAERARVSTQDEGRSGTVRARGADLALDSDLAELRERLRELPRAPGRVGEGRQFWLGARGVPGLPERARIGGGTVEIGGTPFEDTRGLETWLRARMRAAGVEPDR